MQGRKDSGANVGRITRALKNSVVLDENEVQRRQTSSKDNVVGKEGVPRKRGLIERSLNVTTRSLGVSLKPVTIKKEQQEAIKTVPGKTLKSSLRFGGGNTLISIDCADDIDCYMRHLEEKQALPSDFLADHCNVDGRMRQILVDWLVHVQRRFSLLAETLSLAVFILDRAMIHMQGQITKNNLQLLGVSCLFVASKFEEIIVPNIQDFVYVAADAFSKRDVLRMEQSVLKSINFMCSISHSIQFLRRYRFYLSAPKPVHNLAKFVSETALVMYSFAHHKPSTIAAVSFFIAALVHKFQIQPSVYKEVMLVDEAEVAAIARELCPHVLQMGGPKAKLYALREKYSKEVVLPFNSEQIERMEQFYS